MKDEQELKDLQVKEQDQEQDPESLNESSCSFVQEYEQVPTVYLEQQLDQP